MGLVFFFQIWDCLIINVFFDEGFDECIGCGIFGCGNNVNSLFLRFQGQINGLHLELEVVDMVEEDQNHNKNNRNLHNMGI